MKNTYTKISQLLIILGIALLLAIYFLGAYHPYLNQEDAPQNLSFQPFSFLIPADAEPMHTQGELESVLGLHYKEDFPNVPIIYDYEPHGVLAALGGYYMLPIWQLYFLAPQYPQGLSVTFTMTAMQGDVSEINAINHYIGMKRLEAGAFYLRKISPFIFLLFIIMLIASLFYRKKHSCWLLVIPALFPLYFFGFYILFLYKFGHYLHKAPIHLKPFMPVILGSKKIAQFTITSYPEIGFYALCFLFFILMYAIYLRKKVEKCI